MHTVRYTVHCTDTIFLVIRYVNPKAGAIYEVSSRTNATDLLKTKRFKLESYFLQHKVSLIFRWFIQIIVLTPKHRRKAVVSRHSSLYHRERI